MKTKSRFRLASRKGDFERIAELAHIIWREHYIPIIGKGQVEYMLDKYQSAYAVKQQAADGMCYYLIYSKTLPAGYFAFEKREKELFLSKIYLLNTHRGLGLGTAAMKFISDKARDWGCSHIALTVNKNNDRSISAYQKLGFENKGVQITDIGSGYIMDDFRMVKTLTIL
ncbi:MAG: GNAT family N-acetyltransferase [Robiginitalea sp.]|jgi:GNAT superfamily N-acetyltransferase